MREVEISERSHDEASYGKINSSQPDSNEHLEAEIVAVAQLKPDDLMNSLIQSRQDPPQTPQWGCERYAEAYYRQNPQPRFDTHAEFAQPNVVTSLIAIPIEPENQLDADVRNEQPRPPPPPTCDWSLYQ